MVASHIQYRASGMGKQLYRLPTRSDTHRYSVGTIIVPTWLNAVEPKEWRYNLSTLCLLFLHRKMRNRYFDKLVAGDSVAEFFIKPRSSFSSMKYHGFKMIFQTILFGKSYNFPTDTFTLPATVYGQLSQLHHAGSIA